MNEEAELRPAVDADRLDPAEPVAVLFVGGEYPLESEGLRLFERLHGADYRQILFVSVGLVDYEFTDAGVLGWAKFEGKAEGERLLRKTRRSLDASLEAAHRMGMIADCRVSIGTDEAKEAEALAVEIAGRHPRARFFVTKLTFRTWRWLRRLFHRDMADRIRSRLEKRGLPVTVLPVVLPA